MRSVRFSAVIARLPRLLAGAVGLTTVLALAGCTRDGVPEQTAPTPTATFQMPPPLPAEIIPSADPHGLVPAGFAMGHVAPVVNNGSREIRQVALTFDADMTRAMANRLHSAPGASYANLSVIQTLEQRHIPATFFITGMWVDEYPDVMARLAGNPDFEIANHTWTHRATTANCYGLAQMSYDELAGEVMRTFAKIRPYGGHQTNYFRFPGLCHDERSLAALAPTYVTVIDGDAVSGDPGATAAAPIVSAVLRKAQPGSIVIMHITEDNAKFTDEALPQILDGLAAAGLQPVRLSVLLGQSTA